MNLMAFALMIAAVPFRWTDPSTWSGPIWVWVALALTAVARPLWRWFQRQQAQSWRTVTGRIDSATVRRQKPFEASALFQRRGLLYTAELAYSYSLEGEDYAGTYQRDFSNEEEGQEFVRDLQGKPVIVSCNPTNPASSLLLEDAVRSLLETRPPPPGGVLQPHVADLPEWMKQLLLPFVVLSGVGLVLSLWVHLGALAGRRVVPESWFSMLQMGVILVFIPTLLASQKLVGNWRNDFWKVALRRAPGWMRYMVYGFFGYMVVNFAVIYSQTPHGSGGSGNPSELGWRGSSSFLMAIYSAALAILYSAAVGNGNQP